MRRVALTLGRRHPSRRPRGPGLGVLLVTLVAVVMAAGAAGAAGARSAMSTPPPPVTGGRWSAQSSGTTGRLNGVSFTDPSNGHAVGAGGLILATTDGGRHWARQVACTSSTRCSESSNDRVTADQNAVVFTDPSNGHAVGAGGLILATTDGGRHWARQVGCATSVKCTPSSFDLVTADLSSVSFTDRSNGHVVGARGTVLVTSDGGGHWVAQPACEHMPCPDLTAVSFVDPSEGHAVGAPQGDTTILRANNTGWKPTFPLNPAHDIPLVNLHGVRFTPFSGRSGGATGTFGHAVGDGGVILATVDGGHTWGSQASGTNAGLAGVSFPDGSNGWAVGRGGTIVATTDGGGMWNPQASGTDSDLAAVSFPDANDGWAVGDGGTILALRTAADGLAVTRVVPSSATSMGGSTVAVTGQGFTSARAVYFGDTPAKGFTVVSDTELKAITPRRLEGSAHLTVVASAGTSTAVPVDRVAFFVPSLGTWAETGECPLACDGPGVGLADGRVLVAGGGPPRPRTLQSPPSGGPSRSTAIYDPDGGSWTPTSPLGVPRSLHTLTLLTDGRVLATGGDDDAGKALATAELYDPRSGEWRSTTAMTSARVGHTATRLRDGTVLVVGGDPGSDTAERYDPARGAWLSTPALNARRTQHTTTLLPDGRVLVAGGAGGGATFSPTSAELYDPANNTWALTGPLQLPRTGHAAVLLATGKVLVVGGGEFGAFPFDEIYDPAAGWWTPTTPLNTVRYSPALVGVGAGRVLALGSDVDDTGSSTSAELYDPVGVSWSPASPLPTGESGDHAVSLGGRACGTNCGKLLVYGVGGRRAYLYSPPGLALSGGSSALPGNLLAVVVVLVSLSIGAGALVVVRRRSSSGRS
ncbi:MAG: YCF48-related protein [Actinomycetota bacterium]|nr:YCF48-related protein [Actinomycetota bacterium]